MSVRIDLGGKRYANFNPVFKGAVANPCDADEFDPTSDVPTHDENVQCCCGTAPSAEEMCIQNETEEDIPPLSEKTYQRLLMVWAHARVKGREKPANMFTSPKLVRIAPPAKKIRKTSRKYKKGPRKFHQLGKPGSKDPSAKPKALKKRELAAKVQNKHRRETIRRS